MCFMDPPHKEKEIPKEGKTDNRGEALPWFEVLGFLPSGKDMLNTGLTCQTVQESITKLHWQQLQRKRYGLYIPHCPSAFSSVVALEEATAGISRDNCINTNGPGIAASFKVLVTGASRSGISSLVDAFRWGIVPAELRPMPGMPSIRTRTVGAVVNTEKVRLECVDTPRYCARRFGGTSFPSTKLGISLRVVLVCLDLTDTPIDFVATASSFILDSQRLNSPLRGAPWVLVGTKAESVDRKVSYNIAAAFARKVGLHYIETDARQSKNVEMAFYLAVSLLMKTWPKWRECGRGASPNSLKTRAYHLG
ncbi:unnamed protein product [Chrysoparadoxa australica]